MSRSWDNLVASQCTINNIFDISAIIVIISTIAIIIVIVVYRYIFCKVSPTKSFIEVSWLLAMLLLREAFCKKMFQSCGPFLRVLIKYSLQVPLLGGSFCVGI